MLITAQEIISQCLDLYKKNWQVFIKYAALLLVPSLITTYAYLFLVPQPPLPITDGIDLNALSPTNPKMLAYILIAIIASIVSIWFSIAFVRVIIARYQGQTAKNIKEEIMDNTKLIIPVILVSLLVGIIVLGGLFLLIIPGLIFSIWYAFTFYAVAVDGKKVKESLGVSKALVKGRWWSVLWRLFLPGFIFAVIMSMASWIFTLPFNYLPKNLVVAALSATVASIITMLIAPLATAAPSILYVELKRNPTSTAPTEPKTA